MIYYYGEIEYTSGYLGCQDVRERERVTVELRGTVGPYINNWLILHLVTGAGFVLPTHMSSLEAHFIEKKEKTVFR